MPWLDGGLSWVVLAVALFFFTFGSWGLLFILYGLCLVAGLLLIAFYHGKINSLAVLQVSPELPMASPGLGKILPCMENMTKIRNFDKRMTGASVIDDALNDVLEHTTRDYIKNWYRQISDHDGFLLDIRQCVQKVVITFASRTKDTDWMPYFTQRLTDDFASHIRLFRRAMEKTSLENKKDTDKDNSAVVEKHFFDLEVDMEGDKCRDLVCLSAMDERQYLQDLSEVLLFLLLPTEDFHNKPFRYIIREVLVNGIIIPTIDLLSDPDYINQYIAWLCKDGTFTNESFMTVIKSTDSIEELLAIKDMVDCDISRWRSKDTGGSDDTLIKQNLSSLIFVRNLCETRVNRLKMGIVDTEYAPDVPDYCKSRNFFVLTLDDIMQNNVALSVFIEFMTGIGGQQYLFFYLNVEGFRAAADLQLEAVSKTGSEANLEHLRKAATIIFDQYLAEKASSRIKIESDILKRVVNKMKQKSLSANIFDEVQARVYQILHSEQYYEKFIQSNVYVKLLEDLGFNSNRTEDGDTSSLDDDVSVQSEPSTGGGDEMSVDPDSVSLSSLSSVSRSESYYGLNGISVTAEVSQTGIVRESEKTGKSYAIFSIRVFKKIGDEEEIWDVYRRYSDFHDLHMIIQERFPHFQDASLPPKTVLKKMSDEFLDKRKKALDNYLQTLLNLQLWDQYRGLRELVMKFLAPGMWEKHKSDLARKMDTIVNPLKTSVKTVGHAVKHVPDGIKSLSSDGLGKVFRTDSLGSKDGDELPDRGKVGAGLDPEIEQNIPLRIMLRLMDEVFDLRHKNQWLRRQIGKMLRQLIKAAYGDTINRKIVEHVDWLTSAEQMAEYIKAFRDSFWPEGILAEPRPPRDHNTKMRTRVVCKAKMLGSIPDELRHLMGTESIKAGNMRVFQLFQYKSLNKRLVYVCLEGIIETVFPQNKFPDLFNKLHSRSARLHTKELEKGDHSQDSLSRKKTTKS